MEADIIKIHLSGNHLFSLDLLNRIFSGLGHHQNSVEQLEELKQVLNSRARNEFILNVHLALVFECSVLPSISPLGSLIFQRRKDCIHPSSFFHRVVATLKDKTNSIRHSAIDDLEFQYTSLLERLRPKEIQCSMLQSSQFEVEASQRIFPKVLGLLKCDHPVRIDNVQFLARLRRFGMDLVFPSDLYDKVSR